jgi:hypothetical protein
MPRFNIDVDFEVYCNTCGYGLCFDSITGETRNRKEQFVKVNVCPVCMKEKEDEIADLKRTIEELENKLGE